ncbi:MAG: hypothetical protein N3E48_03640 [Candidatus Bathyarchaeota archaeon]|nr:hypothetical protein [Candidatus Bathyarchaeota archaeon]
MSKNIKRMAEALKTGATMLNQSCPQCNSPLFKLPSEEIYCFTCDKKVVIVKSDEEAFRANLPLTLIRLEESLMVKLQQLEQKIREEENLNNLKILLDLTISTLEALKKIKKIGD